MHRCQYFVADATGGKPCGRETRQQWQKVSKRGGRVRYVAWLCDVHAEVEGKRRDSSRLERFTGRDGMGAPFDH